MSEPIVTKRCYKCKQVKSISCFHKDNSTKDGRRNMCKHCVYLSHQAPKYKKQQAKYSTKYKHSDKYKTQHRKGSRKYGALHPGIKAAQMAVSRAVKSGRLPNLITLICLYCGNKAKYYHHPNGYDKEHRFDVVPVCCKCHMNIHRYGLSSSGTKPVTEPLNMVLSEVPEETEP